MFERNIETMSRNEMQRLQLTRLQNIVQYAYQNVQLYKDKFDAINLKPSDIKCLKDIEKIPYTTKDDLRENYPFKLLAKPMKEMVRLHASSGTTGKPIVVAYTAYDIDNWAKGMARVIMMAGGNSEDIVQISFGYGLFTGAFGLHQGWDKIGATVVPISSGNTERQIMIMKDFGVTALIATPSYAMYLAETAKKMGVEKDLKLRIGLFGAEASTNEMHEALRKILNIIPTENYGLTEISGPGVAGECLEKKGMHINEDLFYPEIVNFEENKVLGEGEYGELILTTLLKEGMPILRYRTKDITSLNYEVCGCGRTLVRMNRIKGRTDDMLIIRGVNVFPSQIESVLMEIDEIGNHYEIILKKEGFMDTIEVHVEVGNGEVLTDYSNLEKLKEKISHKLKTVLQLDIKVKLVEPFSLKRAEGKTKRVIDNR